MTNHVSNAATTPGGWGRARLMGILTGAVATALVLLVGLSYSVYRLVTPSPEDTSVVADGSSSGEAQAPPDTGLTAEERRTSIAAAPMLQVPAEAMKPSAATAADDAPQITVPVGASLGPANVLTGFPHTPEGAVGQLAQLEATVLQAMSLQATAQIHDAWAMRGGPGVPAWGLAKSVTAFLTGTGMVGSKDPGITVRVQPVAAMIKGTDGPDWVTACVLMQISASFRDQAEVAYGYCERMQWSGGRWMVAPGTSPAPAPSTWPGTPLAHRAGWHSWATEVRAAAGPGQPQDSQDPSGHRPSAADLRSDRGDQVSDVVHLEDTSDAAQGAMRAAGLASTGESPSVTVVVADGGATRPAAGPELLPDLIPDPLGELGEAIAKAAADGWTAAMLAVWSAGLFVLRIALQFTESLLTPDLSETGPGRVIYEFAFWMAGALVVALAMVQLGLAAFRREGKSLAVALIGAGQFVVVCAAWVGYCVTFLAACTGLNAALMKALLDVRTWEEWDPLAGFDEDITDATVATVLGLLGCVVWVAALGHLLIMLARAASLMVLVATGPIAAAGLVSDAGRSWFWKSLRWFHAAALTPPLMVLVLGIGIQFSTGVAAGMADSTMQAIGTAVPGVMLLCISCVAPLALFKLLAFVDPGTPSGSSFRQGMSMAGGLQGLMSGGGTGGSSAAASQADENGRSAGESSAETSTNDRFTKGVQGSLSTAGGGLGTAVAAGMGMIQSIGTRGASLMGDETNQSGVGHHTYGPDFSSLQDRKNDSRNDSRRRPPDGSDDDPASTPPPSADPPNWGSGGYPASGPTGGLSHGPASSAATSGKGGGAVPGGAAAGGSGAGGGAAGGSGAAGGAAAAAV